jgi:hypothetical protein
MPSNGPCQTSDLVCEGVQAWETDVFHSILAMLAQIQQEEPLKT